MSAERRSVREIFLDAAEKYAPQDRAHFLATECGNDLSLRERIESLLRAREADTGFMQTSAAELLTGTEIKRHKVMSDSTVGSMIGRYLLLEKIGEGGMGAVYMALQQEPVRRRVALKIIKAGLDTREFVRRFEAERQALALMNHANIAKVLDGGTTQAGLPYFVMELVDGSPITEFCDAHKLRITQRLSLLIDVCHAVQHAHQQGIVHRDLKPGNILVEMQEDGPIAKIIDFGVAKVVEQQHTLNSLNTSFQQLIGTPLYMSPEQAGYKSQRIDLRSDVYSLGVILYELICGQTPFDREALRQVGPDELRRIIREDEPLTPSTRFGRLEISAASMIAGHCGVDRGELQHLLRRELDWITMKALDKDRSRRYGSPGEMAKDLKRHLQHEAVEASPPSQTYRFRKFATKHIRILAILFCAVFSLVAGVSLSLWQASEAEFAKQQTLELQKTAQKERLLLQRVGIREAYAAWERREFSEATALLQNVAQVEHGSVSVPERRMLDQEIRENFRVLLESDKPLHEVRVIPGTNHVAAVGGDGNIYVVDVPSGRLIRRIATGVRSLHALAVSTDGKLLATGGVTELASDRSLPLVFDLQTGEQVLELAGQLTTIESLMFSGDGRYLLCGSRYENAQLFDLSTKVAVEIPAHDRHRWFSRSGDNQYFAAQESEESLWIARAEPPFAGRTIPLSAVPVAAGWIPGTDILASFLDGSDGIRMRIDSLTPESDGNICDFIGVKNSECIMVDETRSFVAAGLTNGELICWPFPTSLVPAPASDVPKIAAEDRLLISDHSLTSITMLNQWILVTTFGGKLLAVRQPEHLLTSRHRAVPTASIKKTVAWFPDGQRLLMSDDKGVVWHADVFSSSNAAVHALHDEPSEKGTDDARQDVFRHDDMSPNALKPFPIASELALGDPVHVSAASPGLVSSAAISEDEKSIAFVRNSFSVILIQSGVERVLHRFNKGKSDEDEEYLLKNARDTLQFSPDSQRLAWICHNTIYVADAVNPTTAIRRYELPHRGYCLAWAQRGEAIFAGGSFQNVVQVDLQTSNVQTVGDSNGETGVIAISCNGQLMSGHSDGALRFWHPDHSSRSLHFHDSPVTSLAISPDGRIGVSVDRASNLAVWYVDSGERIGMLRNGLTAMPPTDSCYPKPRFSSDGKLLRLAFSAPDGGLRVVGWNLE